MNDRKSIRKAASDEIKMTVHFMNEWREKNDE